jgi:predicted Zn-dependent protease
MAKTKHGASPPALLSTHPADAQRVENIRKLLPEAMQYYNK